MILINPIISSSKSIESQDPSPESRQVFTSRREILLSEVHPSQIAKLKSHSSSISLISSETSRKEFIEHNALNLDGKCELERKKSKLQTRKSLIKSFEEDLEILMNLNAENDVKTEIGETKERNSESNFENNSRNQVKQRDLNACNRAKSTEIQKNLRIEKNEESRISDFSDKTELSLSGTRKIKTSNKQLKYPLKKEIEIEKNVASNFEDFTSTNKNTDSKTLISNSPEDILIKKSIGDDAVFYKSNRNISNSLSDVEMEDK